MAATRYAATLGSYTTPWDTIHVASWIVFKTPEMMIADETWKPLVVRIRRAGKSRYSKRAGGLLPEGFAS